MTISNKSILIVTQYFYPETFRINDLAIELKKRGFHVSVLTGLPNYPIGDYFEGYSRDKQCDELWNEIPIYRCKLRPRYTGSLNLIRNYLSFVKEANKKLKQINELNFDLIYVFEVSPITVALPAIKLKKKKNIPLIMNVQDLWPENIVAVTKIHNVVLMKTIKILVRYIYRHCDLILAASKGFVGNISCYLNENNNRVKFWPQYSVVKKEMKRKNLFNSDYFNIVFTGNLGEAQGLDIVIEAAKELLDTPIRWHLIGSGRNEDMLREKVSEYGLQEHIYFHGSKPESEIPQYLANADAALLILKPNPVFEMAIPAKLQTYMACGIPIIGCVSGESKRIIEEANAGFVTDEISKTALINVCREIIEFSKSDYKCLCDNALAYGNKNFDKDILMNILIKEMEELL